MITKIQQFPGIFVSQSYKSCILGIFTSGMKKCRSIDQHLFSVDYVETGGGYFPYPDTLHIVDDFF